MRKALLILIAFGIVFSLLIVLLITPKRIQAPPSGPVINSYMTQEEMRDAWIRGEIKTLPPEASESQLVQNYLYQCSIISDDQERHSCYEVYFINHDPQFAEQKRECNGDPICLDGFYKEMATTRDSVFCFALRNEEERVKCKNSME
jgi:hypothetical protein